MVSPKTLRKGESVAISVMGSVTLVATGIEQSEAQEYRIISLDLDVGDSGYTNFSADNEQIEKFPAVWLTYDEIAASEVCGEWENDDEEEGDA
jgi:hypothetical protein